MGGTEPETTAEELLAHAAWLRRLALRLVADADVADDLVQETWIAAARSAPEPRQSLRPWLAKVLRDAFRMRARSEGRRSAREQAVSLVADDVPTPELLVARAEAQKRLVDLVLALEEPYRGAVLLHFCEGVSLADIARAQGVPAGTVRWRMKVALDRLRASLDESADRRQWTVALLALPKGTIVAHKTSTIAVGLILFLLALGGGILAVLTVTGQPDTTDQPAHHRSAAGPSSGASFSSNDPTRLPAWLAQPDVAARRIAGRVVTAEGVPVEGATVGLVGVAVNGGLVDEPRSMTGATGEFDFGPQPATMYTVHASAPARTGASLAVDLGDPTARPPPDRLELKLAACDRAMVGTIRDASGGPIAGARVTWMRANRPTGEAILLAGVEVESDANGSYELCVDGGRTRVTAAVSADGYGAIEIAAMVWGRDRFDFSLVPEATVVGRVIREDDGQPVAQAYVTLSPDQRGAERTGRRAAFSDAEGGFRITGVAPGRHVVGAIGDHLATARETPIVVEAGQTTDDMELVVETRSMVTGVVTDGGKPVAGALVWAKTNDPGRTSDTAVSQADGSFVLGRVPRGQVRFVARPYEVVSPRTFQVERARHDGVAIEVGALGTITGLVVRGDRPVDGAQLELHGSNSNEVTPVRTGADGRFEARGLRPGRWVVYGSSEQDGAFGRAPDVQLERGGKADIRIDLMYSAAISGMVVDQDGEPVPGVSVEFRHGSMDDFGFATTPDDGRFRAATMVGGGSYEVTVRRRSGSSGGLRPAAGSRFPRVLLADGASEVTGLVLAVRLDRLSIAGRVVDENGDPVADARVAAEVAEQGLAPSFSYARHQASAVTDVEGRFSIGDLSAGSYAVQARASTGQEAVVHGVSAGRKDLAIVLPSPGTVEGTLVGFGEAPRVFAARQGSSAAGAVTRGSVSGSTFSIRLTPGTYVVSGRSSTEAASARVDVRAGATSRITLTSSGTGSVAGRVRDFASGIPVEGMTCTAWPRVGTERTIAWHANGARSGLDGAFELTAVPAGELAIFCHGAALYSNGVRLIDVAPGQRAEVEVPVVRIRNDVSIVRAGIGAELDEQSFVGRLDRVRPGGPSATAGLRDGDVIIAVDGEPVTELSPRGIWLLIANRPPGTSVEVTVRRGRQRVTGRLVLGPSDPR